MTKKHLCPFRTLGLFLLVVLWSTVPSLASASTLLDLSGKQSQRRMRIIGDSWKVENGELRQASPRGRAFAFLPAPAYTDAKLSFQFQVQPLGAGVRAAGAVLRSTDSETFYGVHFDTRNDQVVLYVSPWRNLPTWIVLARKSQALSEGQWYQVEITARAGRLTVALDEKPVLEAEDDRYPAGRLGLYTSEGAASFKEVRVEGTQTKLPHAWKVVKTVEENQERFVVCSGEDAGGYAAFPDLCRTANGDLLCVFYSGYGHVSNPTQEWPRGGRIMACRSTDGGKSWTKPLVLSDTLRDDRDPHIAALSDGTLICNWFATRDPDTNTDPEDLRIVLYTSRSTDQGKTWAEPERLILPSTHWFACSAPIRELPDKSLILGLYTEDSTKGTAYGATVKSYDRGKTWQDLALIGKEADLYLDAETDIIRLKDGSLLAALRSSKTDLYFATSTDDGKSWGPVRSSGFKGHCPLFLRTRNGTILLGQRLPNTALRWSTDEGQTWQGPLELDNVIGAYPGLAEWKDGSVYCVYYEEGAGSSIRGVRLRVDRSGVTIATKR